MPDKPSPFLSRLRSFDEPVYRPHLVRSHDNLFELVILPGKEDEIMQNPDDSVSVEECLNEGLIVTLYIFLPVEKRLN